MTPFFFSSTGQFHARTPILKTFTTEFAFADLVNGFRSRFGSSGCAWQQMDFDVRIGQSVEIHRLQVPPSEGKENVVSETKFKTKKEKNQQN